MIFILLVKGLGMRHPVVQHSAVVLIQILLVCTATLLQSMMPSEGTCYNLFLCSLKSFYLQSVLISLPLIQLHTPYLLNNYIFRTSRCYWYAHNASVRASSFTTVITTKCLVRFLLLSEGVNLLKLFLCWICGFVFVCGCWGGTTGQSW